MFKKIPGFDKYSASKGGVIVNNVTRQIIKPRYNTRGYAMVMLSNRPTKTIRRTVYIHRAVWAAFNGKIPSGMQINHLNFIKDDNRLRNLELTTPKENMAHWVACGTLIKARPVTVTCISSGEKKNYKYMKHAIRELGLDPRWAFRAVTSGETISGYKIKDRK
jgi:hypothetical protein